MNETRPEIHARPNPLTFAAASFIALPLFTTTTIRNS